MVPRQKPIRRHQSGFTLIELLIVVAVIGIFGLAWLGDSFIAANKDVIVPAIGAQADAHPWTFAFGLFFASVLLYSQAATTRALMPLGMALGIPPQFLIAMFPSVDPDDVRRLTASIDHVVAALS